ncbi:uncharacterized protein LOC108324591 [Vigna angularis]|uniref:uncharacterized protein LOC108324591 n=1 Tax=Phaseolus angularis TaxID=3914 RepID=UPI000809AECC|nr:uncharacterized protein LOC108324591 [Vigna angularis]
MEIEKILDMHTCSRQFNIKMMNAKWLSETLDTTLHENPNLKINEIRSKALRKWNTNVTISKARREKLIASCKVEGSFKNQFTRIYDYAHELLRCNPGSTIKVKVNSENGHTTFQRFYVCLKACKNSFISCRPFICLDGCFLKRKYKGELLTAIGRDPNEQMLPLTYAIVEVENKETWTWFLELLIEDLGDTEVCNSCTFMSDQQKGLLPAMPKLLPGAEHSFYMRHLYANFKKKFRGHTLKNVMWKAATSTYPQAWEREMLNIKDVNVEAYKYLIAIPPRSKFTGRALCDTLVNSMSEAFNSVIVDARGNPIITMLEEIRVYLMKKWATNIIKMCNMNFHICPKIRKRLTKESNLSKNWISSWSGEKMFEVRHFAVMTNKFTCRKWVISGIPCCHAIAAMRFLNLDLEEYVLIWFIRSTYDETYASIIFLVNGHLLWERTAFPNVFSPFKRKLPGRPKKKRRLESWELRRDETQMAKGGHRKKCSICRIVGHNRNQCPLRPQDQPDLPQPSEATPQPPTQEMTQPCDAPPQPT